MEQIAYREGYKYQLYQTYWIQTSISPVSPFYGEFLEIRDDGMLIIYEGYAWDGPSGPTIDDTTNMRGSLVHDALYQLMRLSVVSRRYRGYADHLLAQLCMEDGMCPERAYLWEKAVNLFAEPSARKENDRPVILAPVHQEPVDIMPYFNAHKM